MKLVLGSLFILMALEAYFAPFTKVEESFNLQATFDLLHHVDRYDHLDFSGVVPRTFLGATLLSALTWPFLQLFPGLSLIDQQVLVRTLLAALVVFALGQFASGIRVTFGAVTAKWTMALLLCQFHLVFWSSRTLPNTLALPWTVLGLGHWLSSLGQTSNRAYHLRWMIRYLTFAGVVFRFEVGVLLVVLLAFEMFYKSIGLASILRSMMTTSFFSLLLSVPLDSYLWGKWIWPEFMVFYFNVILNKSSEWGALPFHAYFFSFLPRLLLISYPLAMVGFVRDQRVRRMLMPVIAYLFIFSCLPHKEWRFIMYTIPLLTTAAAVTIQDIRVASCRSWFYKAVLLAVFGGVIASFVISITLFQISRLNYPGGDALVRLHALESPQSYVSVHMDPETCMTGASLYGQLRSHWTYSKNESHLTEEDFIEARYTHLITAHPEQVDSERFRLLDTIVGLDKVKLKSLKEYKQSITDHDWMPLQFELAPKLYILKLNEPQKTWIEFTVQRYPVVLYSKTYCPYCRAAKQLISKYCKDIQVIEVDQEPNGYEIKQALYDLTGQATFPNLFQHGKSLGGYDRLSALDRQGSLAGLCSEQAV
ncbi:Alg9-like mannosyltransferase family-domain-containing protein [Blakeslea trispora]|nr:Alg9-like mannosyltransferase family-domain-containing protein [Blakeslea trispora]